MRPILFSIGHLHFYGYGLMIALGIILAVCVAEKRAGRFGLDSSKIFGLGITAAVSGIIGAKILFVITEIPTIIQDPRAFFKALTSEGFVVYGGIIFGILCCMFYCRRNKMDFIRYFDLTMPSVALAQGFGRLGCFLAGCCYGRATDAWYGMVFRASSYAPSDTAVIPTQLLSSALNFINFLVLCLFARKAKERSGSFPLPAELQCWTLSDRVSAGRSPRKCRHACPLPSLSHCLSSQSAWF